MTVLGDYGTPLDETPLGAALVSVSDAVTAYSGLPEGFHNMVANHLADTSVKLCQIVLDALLELGVTEEQ